MLHGRIRKLFEGPNQIQTPVIEKLCDQQYTSEQLKLDLIQTLCEEPADFYGFAYEPGWGYALWKEQLRYDFQSSTFIDTLRRIMHELGESEILKALSQAHNDNPSNDIVVHNLGRVFDIDKAQQMVTDPAFLLSRWNRLDRRSLADLAKGSESSDKPEIDLSLAFEVRWEQFLSDQKFKYIYLYFDLSQDESLLKNHILSCESKAHILSSIPIGRRFRRWKKFKNEFETTG